MNHPDNYKEAYEEMLVMLNALKENLKGAKVAASIVLEDNKRLKCDLKDCRNELCLRCGSYREKHLGACDGCRWRADNG